MKTFVLDTETGGLSPYTDGLLSVCIKELNKGDPQVYYLRPQIGKFYSWHALNVNGLDLNELYEVGNSVESILMTLKETFEGHVRLIGHNIEFDLKFILQQARDKKITLPAIEYIDTMQLANKHLKKTKILKSIKLTEVFNHYFPGNEIQEMAHAGGGEADVIMTEMIFEKLWELENQCILCLNRPCSCKGVLK